MRGLHNANSNPNKHVSHNFSINNSSNSKGKLGSE